MAGREGKNDIFVDAVGLELLYIKPNGFYIKLDLAKAAYKYEADGKKEEIDSIQVWDFIFKAFKSILQPRNFIAL
ncbi:hypothetical protein ACL9FO_000020 [Campylobacter coli]|uniref:Uncharacterized protein n=1 Tax=Campylobacter coli 80352 TaxID=887288 RepID=A0ABN0ES37_CAMCO|nr:hypothetical protein [Campylobacter coli]EAL57156.1 conserved hypothetical protein [Campylobacter coli RM2228]EGO9816229.1 hypothetical protein [Campylobacter coli]EHJ4289605.1 hypothetical protein [Campylobacter coli]EHJ4709197.1 hypothetical protein [Campylobacter coli]EHJ7727582.1 hypothetical protein [Campylobacter coli]